MGLIDTILGIVGSGAQIVAEAIPEVEYHQGSSVSFPVGGDPRYAGYEAGIFGGMDTSQSRWTVYQDSNTTKALNIVGGILNTTGASGMTDQLKNYQTTENTKENKAPGTNAGPQDSEPTLYAKKGIKVNPSDDYNQILEQISDIVGTQNQGTLYPFNSKESRLLQMFGRS